MCTLHCMYVLSCTVFSRCSQSSTLRSVMAAHICKNNCDCGWTTDRSTDKPAIANNKTHQKKAKSDLSEAGKDSPRRAKPKGAEYEDTLPRLGYLIDVNCAHRDDVSNAQDRVERHMLECLMDGDWEELWKTLQIYYHARACHDLDEQRPKWWEIWQIGSEALSRTPGRSSFERTVFFREVSKYSPCSKNQVSAEEILHLIAKDKIDEAITLTMKIVPPRGFNLNPHQSSVDDAWKLRRTALTGMLAYIKWLKEDEDNKHNITNGGLEHEGTSRKDRYALQAVRHFETVVDSPGVWDIFINKLAELYQYLGKDQSVKQALRTYWLKNPQNPNAPRYLYNYLISTKAPSSERLEVLQDIVSKHPADTLVVQFLELLFEEFHDDPRTTLSNSVRYMFILLDYPSSAKVLHPWQLFNRILKNILRIRETTDMETLLELWQSRKTWWPHMYFTHKKVSSLMRETPELITVRAVTVVYLEGPDNKFVTKVESWLAKNECPKLYRKILRAKDVKPLEVKDQT